MSRKWELFLFDMIECAAKALRYADGLTLDTFRNDPLRKDAILRNLELLGEAAKKIPEDVRRRHPDIPWRNVAGLRDILAHSYFAVDDEVLWDVVEHHLPDLLARLEALCDAEGIDLPGPDATPPGPA